MQVMAQMDQGITLFEDQVRDEAAVTDLYKKEAVLLSSLIMSSESLSVKLDQQVLSIIDMVNQQSDLQSVLASLDTDLTDDLRYVE